MDVNTAQRQRRAKGVLYYDDVPPPEWRSLYAEWKQQVLLKI